MNDRSPFHGHLIIGWGLSFLPADETSSPQSVGAQKITYHPRRSVNLFAQIFCYMLNKMPTLLLSQRTYIPAPQRWWACRIVTHPAQPVVVVVGGGWPWMEKDSAESFTVRNRVGWPRSAFFPFWQSLIIKRKCQKKSSPIEPRQKRNTWKVTFARRKFYLPTVKPSAHRKEKDKEQTRSFRSIILA